jgi:hypothetical protein
MTYGRSSGSEEDQGAEVSSALVGKGAGSVDQSTNTVRLDGRADNGATPRGSGGGSLLAVEVLLLGVGLLRAAVCVTEDGSENSQRDGVVEGRAEGDGRGLDRGKVCSDELDLVHLCDAIDEAPATQLNACHGASGLEVDLHDREAIVEDVVV